MRLFIAIPFEPPVLDTLTAAQASLKACGVRGNYTVRQNLHMTLAFLGEVRDPRPVIDVLERVPLPQTSLVFGKTGLFHDILVCRFQDDPALTAYVQQLRQALDDSGIDFERKPFRPHVTLVRRATFLQRKPDAETVDATLHELEVPVRSVCLMRTDFVYGRPKYSCIRTCTGTEQD